MSDESRKRAAMPVGADSIISARSLQRSHARLHELLRPGLSVLDVGCGNGAITRGAAERVGPGGRVVGVDVNERLIEDARRLHAANLPNLSFDVADAYDLGFREEFDVVSAARVLQWLRGPAAALRSMVEAAKPGGLVIVLDYNHEKIEWHPEPPDAARRFYDAFLHWRAEAGMDNGIADRLPDLFAQAGLVDVRTSPQHEAVRRGEEGFERSVGIWAEVMASRGLQMVEDGAITEEERSAAETSYRRWMAEQAVAQRMYLLAVEGTKPGA